MKIPLWIVLGFFASVPCKVLLFVRFPVIDKHVIGKGGQYALDSSHDTVHQGC